MLIASQSMVRAKARPAAPWRARARGRRHRRRALRRTRRCRRARPACRCRRREPGWSRPMATAATTGSAHAIASSVTLPKDSVIDGLRKMSPRRARWRGRSPVSSPVKMASGKPLGEPRPRRAFADHQHSQGNSARLGGVDRVGEHVEPFFEHQPAEEGDDHLVVGDAVRGAERFAAALGIELAAVDRRASRSRCRGSCAGRGGSRRSIRPARRSHRSGGRSAAGWRARSARAIAGDNSQDRFRSGCGPRRRPGFRARRAQLIARCATMSGLATWMTLGANAARSRRTAGGMRSGRRYSGAARDGDGGDADEVAGRLERRLFDRRRIDPHLGALAQQEADQPVERLVGAVADIIIIAREQGDAQRVGLHCRALAACSQCGNRGW